MFDVNLLDRMNFGQLGEALAHVIEKMEQLSEEGSADEDDPRQDVLLVIANQIVLRMDPIIRDNGPHSPELLAQWNEVEKSHREGFKKYSRDYLKEGVPLVLAEPEGASQAADAAWRAKLDEVVLDEKLLDGMGAGDLFEVNRLITEKVEQYDKELPEDVAGPLIEKLLKFGDLVFKRLDPLVRETYKDNPESLAQWEAIVNDYKGLDDEGGEDARADIESSEIS